MSLRSLGPSCSVQGWPAVRLTTPTGTPMSVRRTDVRATGAWGPYAPVRITLARGQSAASYLLIGAPATVGPTDAGCRTTFDWQVRPAGGDRSTLSFATVHQWWAAICPHRSVIAISPFHRPTGP